MAFVDEVAYYAGSTSGKNSEVSKFLTNGTQYIINLIEKSNPEMLPLFASLQTLTNVAPQLSLATNFKIIDIVRDSADSNGELLKCNPINAAYRSNASNVDSIYYADANSPVYYIDNAVLSVIPEPTANQNARISIVLPDTSVDHNHTSIANFPSEMYHAVILYAASQLLHHKMTAINAKLPTDLDEDLSLFNAIADLNTSISVAADIPASFSDSNVGSVPTLNIQSGLPSEYTDAITKAKNLINVGIVTDEALGTSDDATTFSAGYWLKDEDEEMVQSTLTVASQELQRASSWLAKYQNDINKEMQEFTVDMQTYQGKVSEEGARSGIDSTKFQSELALRQAQASEAVTEFNTNVQKKLSLYTTVITKLTTDYQWLQGQYQLVKSEFAEFMAPYTTGGVLDSTVEGVRR